jgi:hypothetical protein
MRRFVLGWKKLGHEKRLKAYIAKRRFDVPRPISWLPRLAEIRRSVKNSTRSHYERCRLGAKPLGQIFHHPP